MVGILEGFSHGAVEFSPFNEDTLMILWTRLR
jgi:hypothetical protein